MYEHLRTDGDCILKDLNDLSNNIFLKALMEGAFSGVVFVDSAGLITGINDRARAYLDCRRRDISGEYIGNLFPLLDENILNDVIRGGDSVANLHVRSNTARFAVNIEPVDGSDMPKGAVIVLQRLPPPTERARSSVNSNIGRYRFSGFQFADESFQRALKSAKFAAQYDSPILLVGEDGTEIPNIAKCIHNESGRKTNGYAEVECDALSADQISHLLFEQPDSDSGLNRIVSSIQGGTLYLSHVDRLSPDLQYRINLLARGQYMAENDIHRHPADIRIIASTDKSLKDRVRENLFREDLYYSLSVTTISVPPLRDRGDDVIDIANMYIERYSEEFKKPVKLTAGAYDSLRQYSWPGNNQELDFFCRRVVANTPRHSVNEAFIRSVMDDFSGTPSRQESAGDIKNGNGQAAAIAQALKRNGGSRTKTAAELGVSKATLWRHMQKYGIQG